MRKVFAIVAGLFAISGVLQLYFAAIGVFSNPEDELFSIHGTNGRIVLPILALLTIVSAALARAGRRTIWLSVIALLLLIVQTLLFVIVGAAFGLSAEDHEQIPIGATILLGLHGLNGLAILGLSGAVASRAWRLGFGRNDSEPALGSQESTSV